MDYNIMRSLTNKLLAFYIPLILVGVLCLFAILEVRHHRTQVDGLQTDLRNFSNNQAPILAKLLWDFDTHSIKQTVANYAINPDLENAIVYDAEGLVVSLIGASAPPSVRPAFRYERELSYVSGGKAKHLGRFVATFHTDRIDDEMKDRILTDALILLVLAVGLVWGTQRVTAHIIGRPLTSLLNTIEQSHTEGAWDKVEWSSSDELGEVINAYNEMQEMKATAESKLLDYQEHLEETIEERTAELKAEIIERENLEKQLFRSQRMEAVGQLTGGVAHDFNNLLAITMSNAQLLELQLKGRDDLLELTSSIVKSAQRGAALTHRLLAFSRQQTLQAESICLGELCEGMRDLLSRTLGETVNLQIESKGEIWNVMADPGQVENALLNLALNASHAMPGGGSIGILIENAPVTSPEWAQRWEGQPGDYVALRVIDTGTGIPKNVLNHVFEPFFTTKEVGKGSGLGLSMVYGLAQQSGGFVTIESEEGNGTTVSIYLPRTEDNLTGTEEQTADTELPKGHGETILLVEDEASVRDATIKLLEWLGYIVLDAEEGAAALAISSNAERIDLLLSDMVLPGGMNGIDVFNHLSEQRPDLKCLFMSGYASLPDHQLPKDAEILTKPVTMCDFAGKVRQILEA